MAQPPFYAPPPPRPGGGAWTIQRSPAGTTVAVVAFIAVFAFVLLFMFMSFAFSGIGFPFAIFVPFCGVFLVAILLIALGAAGWGQRRPLPPPPPIQQPMVPAGMQGPIALSCPNCGAPPSNVDRFGVATCPYCSTRFLVR